jgi:hypothetical protein
MEGDNWKDETLPGRHAGSDRSAADEGVRHNRLAISIRVLGGIVALLALTLCGLWSLYLLRGRAVYVGPTPTPIIWTPTSASISIASPHPPSAEMNKPSPTVSLEIVMGSCSSSWMGRSYPATRNGGRFAIRKTERRSGGPSGTSWNRSNVRRGLQERELFGDLVRLRDRGIPTHGERDTSTCRRYQLVSTCFRRAM